MFSIDFSATGQSFSAVLKWLEMVRKRESGELTKPQQPVVPISRRGPDKEYSRYKQEDFKATGITGSFNIDTRGTNASKSFNSLVAGNKRYVTILFLRDY